jgi:hypothetical protein
VEIEALSRLLQLPVYLAVTPIAGSRDRLAGDASGTGDRLFIDEQSMRPCERLSDRNDRTLIKTGFHAYVEDLVRRFQPRFLALSIEVNRYAAACPAAWPEMKALLNAEYNAQKRAHPDLVVFHTFQVEAAWEASERTSRCIRFRRDCLTQNLATLADLKTDLFALASYPIEAYVRNGRNLPSDYLAIFGTLTHKRLAIADTAYPGTTMAEPSAGGCIPGLPSSSDDQDRWVERLLTDADRLSMPFVVWGTDHALLPLGALAPCRCTADNQFCAFLNALSDDERTRLRASGLSALRDYDGIPQQALTRWSAAVARVSR